MENLSLTELIELEMDRRKITQLIDDGIITPQELANAMIVEVKVTPACDCGFDISLKDEIPRCPACGKAAIIDSTD